MVYLDTHAVIWLYAKRLDLFNESALKTIESEELRVSPMVILEAEYLYEIKRISERANVIYHFLSDHIGLRQCGTPFQNVVQFATQETFTHDPFDRIIVAQAKINESRLITKDQSILKVYEKAVW